MSTRSKLSQALVNWSDLIGSQNVFKNVDHLKSLKENVNAIDREIMAVLRPESSEAIQSIVRIANQFKVPLYPISCGYNWGYGSHLPVRNNAVILDLSSLNQIRNENSIDTKDHYAVIEPGVTQGQLYEMLRRKKLPLVFNATAAGADTSVLGNALERGYGYFSCKQDDICGMEIVLGNGEILHTSHRHYKNAQTKFNYKYGLGPDLNGLFFQSNFGVVVSAAFNLIPKRECHAALLVKLKEEKNFEKFIDTLGELRQQSIIESIIHIANSNRGKITLGPIAYKFMVEEMGEVPGDSLRKKVETIVQNEVLGCWTAIGGLYGTGKTVEHVIDEIRDSFKGFATVDIISSDEVEKEKKNIQIQDIKRAIGIRAVEPLLDFSLGVPSDGALFSPLWSIGEDVLELKKNLDRTKLGILFCNPAFPLNGKVVVESLKCVEQVFSRHGFLPYMTFNIVDTKSLILVLNMTFNKEDKKRSEDAHRCVDELFDVWKEMGIYPYRLGIQSMEQFVEEGDVFWETTKALKQVLDPNNIIAPGRYNLV